MSDDLFSGILPFYHAAEERSFRKAAQRLGISAAAVSQAVLRLEERVGVKLLVRTTRTVTVTPEGAIFVARCREAISSIQAGRELVVSSRRQPRGEVKVSLPFILGRLVAPELVRLAERYPELTFRITMTDRLVRLADESIDVAVRIGELEESSLVARHLRSSRWVTVAAPAYIARFGQPTHPSELSSHACLQFVAPNGRARDWSFVDPTGGSPIVALVRGRLLIDHGDHMLEAAASGLGVCQVLDFMASQHLESGKLVQVLSVYESPGPPIHALTVRERIRLPSVRVFVSFLRDTFRRLDLQTPAPT